MSRANIGRRDVVEIAWRRQYPQIDVTKGEWILSIRIGQRWASRLISQHDVAFVGRENLEKQHLPDLLRKVEKIL